MAYHSRVSEAVQSSDGPYGLHRLDNRQTVYQRAHPTGLADSEGPSAILDPNGGYHTMHPPPNQYNQASPDDFSDFPRSHDTVVLSDTMINDRFYGAMAHSQQALSLNLRGDNTNNQSTANMPTPLTPNAIITPEVLEELSGIADLDPMLIETSSEALSYSLDQSSVNSGYSQYHYTPYNHSSMVTGMNDTYSRPAHLPLPPVTVFNEQPSATVRKGDVVPPTPDSIPMHYSQFNVFDDLVMPTEYREPPPPSEVPGQVTVQPREETKQKKGSIGEDLNLIKIMQRKPKYTSGSGLVAPEPLVPASQLSPTPPPTPSQMSTPSSVGSQSPAPRTPRTPPTTTNKGPFSLRRFSDEKSLYFELAVRKDLEGANQIFTLNALVYCHQMCRQFQESLKTPIDLKVANNDVAELCDFTFDSENHKLISKLPKDCVPLDKFLKAHSEKLDLRVRQHILQQVLNALANVHTTCGRDKISFWGSFLVWVAKDMKIHLLLDFPVMLAKMEQSSSMAGYDPRLDDLEAVYKMYSEMFQPFICSNANWSSPGLMKLLGKRFEGILTSRDSGARMAEVARNFGERRMCKIEVDFMSIETVIYCLEHEPLSFALSPLETMIPNGVSAAWELYQCGTGRLVGKEDQAIAGSVMKFTIQPLHSIPGPYTDALLVISKNRE